jgi:hypothetical protein
VIALRKCLRHRIARIGACPFYARLARS